MKLCIGGIKEAIKALKEINIKILPKSMRLLTKIPEWLLVFSMKKRFNTELGKVALEGHARVARDEMTFLGQELKDLLEESSMETPNLDKLYGYLF